MELSGKLRADYITTWLQFVAMERNNSGTMVKLAL